MIRSLAVYVGPNSVIVAPRHATPDGILYEQDIPIVLTAVSPQSVGAAVKKALDAFSIQAKDLRSAKRSDWPAFRASGTKSMKQFEAEFSCLSVEHVNPSGAVARAELPLPGDEDFFMSTNFNPHSADENVGARVLALAQHAKRFGA
jgi:hypothetical protein